MLDLNCQSRFCAESCLFLDELVFDWLSCEIRGSGVGNGLIILSFIRNFMSRGFFLIDCASIVSLLNLA